MTRSLPHGVEIDPPATGWEAPGGIDEILTDEALAFVADLQRRFGRQRVAILEARVERQTELDTGVAPGFPIGTADVRTVDWKVAPAPADLDDRRGGITGPARPEMMI